MRIGIIGHGYVGKAVQRFWSLRYETIIYDPAYSLTSPIDKIAECGAVSICVPTPSMESGACDTSIVEEVVQKLDNDLIIVHSTVSPGTTQRLLDETNKHIIFCPEYIGESKYHTPPQYVHPTDIEKHEFFVFGGRSEDTSKAVSLYVPIVGPTPFFYQTDATTAEVIKYWENCWGALKVTFANEMYEICKVLGVDYWEAREGWLLDNRTERMHSAVFKDERGFGGKCFPKDVAALVHKAQEYGYTPNMLQQVIETNKKLRGETNE